MQALDAIFMEWVSTKVSSQFVRSISMCSRHGFVRVCLQTISPDLADFGIRLNVVVPGYGQPGWQLRRLGDGFVRSNWICGGEAALQSPQSLSSWVRSSDLDCHKTGKRTKGDLQVTGNSDRSDGFSPVKGEIQVLMFEA